MSPGEQLIAAVMAPLLLAALGGLVHLEHRLTRLEVDVRWMRRAMADRGFTPRDKAEDF